MPIKKLTLGICLLFAGQALAQTRVYTVRSGDTISGLASRWNVSQKAIIRANGLSNRDELSLGQKLTIPNADNDSDGDSNRVVSSGGRYVVKEGDNDWAISKRLGITPNALHTANPDVDWSHIQPGQSLAVPTPVRKISARSAVISKDDVTVRRGAGTDEEAIVTVPKGTHVTVLGSDGDWYRLRFPKGTEGWVRGDMLQPVAEPKPVAQKKRAKAKPAVQARRRHRVRFAADHGKGNGSKKKADEQAILKSASKMRGVRYVWGGMSRSGTDCSGFTSQVYRTGGYRLPRTSREQATVGKPVSGQL